MGGFSGERDKSPYPSVSVLLHNGSPQTSTSSEKTVVERLPKRRPVVILSIHWGGGSLAPRHHTGGGLGSGVEVVRLSWGELCEQHSAHPPVPTLKQFQNGTWHCRGGLVGVAQGAVSWCRGRRLLAPW